MQEKGQEILHPCLTCLKGLRARERRPLWDTRPESWMKSSPCAVILVFKGKIPSRDQGPLPNCLVTTSVFVVLFTNSIYLLSLCSSPETILVHFPGPDLKIRQPEADFKSTPDWDLHSNRDVPLSQPPSFPVAKLATTSHASIFSFPTSCQ